MRRHDRVGIILAASSIAAVLLMVYSLAETVKAVERNQHRMEDRACGALYTTDADIQLCTGRPIILTSN